MLSPNAATVRLFLHVLGATVWVGGQLTLAGLVPGLRALSADAPRTVARRFNRIAWPAFGLLVLTGMWNIAAIEVSSTSTEYQVTLFLHISIAAISGISAFAHTKATTTLTLAIGGALGALSALAALFLGVLLRTG